MRAELEAEYRRLSPRWAAAPKSYIACLLTMQAAPQLVVQGCRKRIAGGIIGIITIALLLTLSDFSATPWMRSLLLVTGGLFAGMLRYQIYSYRHLANCVGMIDWDLVEQRRQESGPATTEG